MSERICAWKSEREVESDIEKERKKTRCECVVKNECVGACAYAYT